MHIFRLVASKLLIGAARFSVHLNKVCLFCEFKNSVCVPELLQLARQCYLTSFRKCKIFVFSFISEMKDKRECLFYIHIKLIV